ncbi:MAG: BatD family protein [Bacteroidota bacterium]|nr:BatD family protein [Bacteroidota bacterium]
MKRKIIFLSLSLLFLNSLITRADEPVRFTASAPSTVVLDKPFQLVYSVNASGRDLRVPEFNNFDVLAGPFESHSSSYQIINGRSTSSVSVSYTYTLQAQKTGSFRISSASINVDNKKFTSNGVSIKVLPADANPPSKSQGGRAGTANASARASISNDNIFMRTVVSKTNVFEQEAILVTYKLYTLVDVVGCTPKKIIDFNGFMKQDIELPATKQLSLENYNGRNYSTVELYKVLLYPQHSGVIQIDKWNFEAIIRVQNKAAVRSIFDDFFDSYTNVSKIITAPAVKINVNALPSGKPSSYSGTVGHFTMNSTITTLKVKANDAVTLKINIAGNGNMKLIKNPTIKFPNGFETYDPKVTNNFKTNASGISGNKSIEYLFIPRHSGDFEIPSAEFTYFDIQDKAYKTLRTPVYKLQVLKGEGGENTTVVGNYVDKEDVKQLGKDIRYIQTDKFELSKEDEPVFGTLLSWLLYLIPLLISIILFIFFRKKVKENSDIILVKNKKANKLAQKRLKLAQRYLKEGNKDQFYEEVLKATWTYLSDKLSIPVSSLTKESVDSELTNHKVESKVINQFIEILNTCEFARFAPNSGQQEMGNLYADTIEAISNLEEFYKK